MVPWMTEGLTSAALALRTGTVADALTFEVRAQFGSQFIFTQQFIVQGNPTEVAGSVTLVNRSGRRRLTWSYHQWPCFTDGDTETIAEKSEMGRTGRYRRPGTRTPRVTFS